MRRLRRNCFVDDLVVQTARNDHFQLKNTSTLSWGNGNKGSLLFDFYYEGRALSGKVHSLALVVSSQDRVRLLNDSRPDLLPENTKVTYFPDENLFGLLRGKHIDADLRQICKSRDAHLDELKYLANVLLARWCDRNGACRTSEFLDPQVRRFLRSDKQGAQGELRPAVRTILDAIPGFKYCVSRGFFEYEYKCTKQIFSFDVFDERFSTVQDWIEKENPREFPALFERMLMTWSESYDRK